MSKLDHASPARLITAALVAAAAVVLLIASSHDDPSDNGANGGGIVAEGLRACGGGDDGPGGPDNLPGVAIVDPAQTATTGSTVICSDTSSPAAPIIAEWLLSIGGDPIRELDRVVLYEIPADELADGFLVPDDVANQLKDLGDERFADRTEIVVIDRVAGFDPSVWMVEKLMVQPELVDSVGRLQLEGVIDELLSNPGLLDQFNPSQLLEFEQRIEQFDGELLERFDARPNG